MKPHADIATLVVCIIGVESTGKTTLAQDVADAMDCTLVPERAREYALERGTPFGRWSETEYRNIAEEQAWRIEVARLDGGPCVVTDTDGFTVWVWHRVYTGEPLPSLASFAEVRADLYVLTGLDLPFEADGVRELVIPREEVQKMFVDELVRTRRHFIEVDGSREDRVRAVLEEFERLESPRERRESD